MAALTHCKHWIFDMDGTLTMAAHDFDSIRQSLNLPEGQPILEAIEKLPDDQALETHKKLHQLELDIGATARPQPGAFDTLALLKENDFTLGILTRNAKDIAETTLEAAGLDGFFKPDEIIGRDQCLPKPDPAGIQLHMHNWNAASDSTVMVGDYLFDLQTGRNAGVTTVHFDTSGNFDWPDLSDVKIQRLRDLCQHL